MRCRVINILIFITLSFLSLPLSGQQGFHTKSKKALRFYDQAVQHYDKRDDATALQLLNRAIRADRNFIEAYFMIAQIYKDSGDYETAIKNFRKGLSISPDYYPEGYFILAQIEYNQGLYHDALKNSLKFMDFDLFQRISLKLVQDLIDKCEFAISMLENPVPFNPVNLGDSVNSSKNEYWPSLSLDGSRVIFTVLDPVDPAKPIAFGNRQEDFYESVKHEDGSWSRRRNLGRPLNTIQNEGAQTISADGRFMFFTACNRPDGYGMCDLYFSRKRKGKWTIPSNAGSPLNTTFSEKHPALSADGRIIFFASDRPGGKGGLDIYMSSGTEKRAWTVPVNLGDKINTPGNEQAPFIHPDGKTLYFTSDGHKNLGQSDIFMSRSDEEGTWSDPVNLGFPINTHNNELGLIVNSSGDKAYFASDRHSGEDLDLYEFELYPEVRPNPVSYMKGRVFDSLTYKGLDAEFKLIDIQSGELVIESVSSPGEGEFLIPLPSGRNYVLNVSKTGYLFYSGHFAFEGIYERTDPFIKDVPLQPLRSGYKIVLNNIFFEFDKSELKPESKVELERILDFLQKNPTVRIQLNGHTDNIGTDEYNSSLSERRALAVVDWLINNGISSYRLKHRGFGALLPVAGNETEEGRALNRRTEMQIIE